MSDAALQRVSVSLRAVTARNRGACLGLRVAENQRRFIASNQASLDEADRNSCLVPLLVYDGSARGWVEPPTPPIGFALLEHAASVGFILRLMIDAGQQGRGYGAALLAELVRRLRLHPDVEMIATSHRHDNEGMGRLLSRAGFQPWNIDFASENPDERFLRLPNSPY